MTWGQTGAWLTVQHIKQDVLAVIAGDSDRRKRCFAAKRAITPKVGQLTNTREEVVRIVRRQGVGVRR